MDLKQFKFGFVLEVVNRLSPVIAQVEGQIKHLNESVKNTARMREYGENLAKIGGAIAGVGAGIGYGLYKFVEDAATMQTAISKVGATTGLSAAQLGNLKEHAEDFADSNFGVSALEYAAGFGRAYQNLHSYSAAVQAADIATRGAEATGANYAAIIDLVNTAHENFHVAATPVVQMLAATQRQFALSTESMQPFTYGLARLSGVAAQTHTPLADLFALVGESSQLLPGGRGAQLMASLISQLPTIAAKAHLDMSGGVMGVFGQIQQRLQGAAPTQQIQILSALGIKGREGTMLMPLLNNLDKVQAGILAINGDHGTALASAVSARSHTYDAQLALLSHAWGHLSDIIGSNLFGPLARVVGAISGVIGEAIKISKAHPGWVKFAVEVTAISAGLAVGLGSVLAFSGAVVYVTSFVPAAIGLVTTAVGILTAGFGALSIASLAVNPFAWVALGVAAAALIYQYWTPIKSFFTNMVPEFFSAGANIMVALAKGIWSAATWPARAIESVVSKISGFLPHSPAKEGPLRDLHRVRIVESIAATMHPGPALAAMRRVAATVALAAPLIAVPAMAASIAVPRIAAPAIMSAPASAGTAGSSGAVVINVTQHNVIHGGDPETIARELRERGYELAQIIGDEMKRRARTDF